MNILVIEDNPVLILGFSSIIIKKYPQSHVITVKTIDECNSISKDKEFSLLLLDIDVADGKNIRAINSIQDLCPKAPILIYLGDEYTYVGPFTQAGATGFISKKSTPKEIQEALTAMIEGNRYISEDVQEWLLGQMALKSGKAALSLNQRIVAQMLIAGKTYVEIAIIMGVRRETIGNYKRRIFQKLGISNIVELSRSITFAQDTNSKT